MLWAAWKARGDSSAFVLVRGIVGCSAPTTAVEYHETYNLIPLDGPHLPRPIITRRQASAFFLRASSGDYLDRKSVV